MAMKEVESDDDDAVGSGSSRFLEFILSRREDPAHFTILSHRKDC